MAVGRLESSRTATNCPMALWTGPDECSSPRQRLCKADNTSVALSLESPCRAGAIRGAKSWDKQSSFNAVNGRKSSSHWLSSKSSCQHRSEYLLLSQIERCSTVRRRARGKDEVQSCSSADSCQSDCRHAVRNWNTPPRVCGSVMLTPKSQKITCASSYAWNFGARPMNRASCGVSNMS